MKLIIAGSRTIQPKEFLWAINQSQFFSRATEVLSGKAEGADTLGELYALIHGIPVKEFWPKWDDLDAPNAKIITRKDGSQYNYEAGHDRNELMAQYGEALTLIWKINDKTGTMSGGSSDMLRRAKRYNLLIETIKIQTMNYQDV